MSTPTEEHGKLVWRDEQGYVHRDDGPALIAPDGTVWWVRHGAFHRDNNLPAYITDNMQIWYVNGKLHRTNGPAWITQQPDGSFVYAWRVRGNSIVNNQQYMQLAEVSEAEMAAIVLQYGDVTNEYI